MTASHRLAAESLTLAYGERLVVDALDLDIGDRFPLDTSTVSVLGEAKGAGALLRWNAPPD